MFIFLTKPFVLIILAFSLSTCGTNTSTEQVPASTVEAQVIEPTTTVALVTIPATSTAMIPQDTPAPSLSSPTTSSDPIVSPSPVFSSTQSVELQDGCPAIVPANTASLLSEGTILFEENNALWSVTNEDLSAHEVYRLEEMVGYFAFYIENGAGNVLIKSAEDEYSIFDLATQSIVGHPVRFSGFPVPLFEASIQWLPGERARFMTAVEQVNDIGETRTYAIIDPNSQQVMTSTEEIDLPGFVSYRTDGLASLDPTGRYVLYTHFSEGAGYYVLRNLQENRTLWQYSGEVFTSRPLPSPYWDRDGSRVFFVTENESGLKLFSLTYDGTEELMPPQPFPFLDEDWIAAPISELSRSLNGRYLFYHWGFDYPPPTEGTPSVAVIIDTTLNQGKVICDDEVATDFLRGQWIADSLFLYLVKSEDEEGMVSLRILNVSTWTVQVLATLNAKPYYDNVFGWTPVEFTN